MSGNPFARNKEPWLPDGVGLPTEVVAEVAARNARVHLRLSKPGAYPKGACGRGLGEWWTGIAAEVTCPACLDLCREAGEDDG